MATPEKSQTDAKVESNNTSEQIPFQPLFWGAILQSSPRALMESLTNNWSRFQLCTGHGCFSIFIMSYATMHIRSINQSIYIYIIYI